MAREGSLYQLEEATGTKMRVTSCHLQVEAISVVSCSSVCVWVCVCSDLPEREDGEGEETPIFSHWGPPRR